MIELTATTAAMIYLSLTLTVLLGLWTYQHYSCRRKKVIIQDRELRVCEFCNFAHLVDLSKAVTQCPQCRCYNKSKK